MYTYCKVFLHEWGPIQLHTLCVWHYCVLLGLPAHGTPPHFHSKEEKRIVAKDKETTRKRENEKV